MLFHGRLRPAQEIGGGFSHGRLRPAQESMGYLFVYESRVSVTWSSVVVLVVSLGSSSSS